MTIRSFFVATALFASPLAFNAVLPHAGPAAAQGADAEMKAFMDVHQKMMSTMSSMKPTGKTDADFVMMMIPHHQGAIDMAQIELKYGKDPMLREMAQQIIKSQRAEIEEMKKWQQKNGM